MIKSLAKQLKLNVIYHYLRKNVPLLLFYLSDLFRAKWGGRTTLRFRGKVAVYDVFICRHNTSVGLVGYYGRLRPSDRLTCTFSSGETIEAEWIDDAPHEYEGQQVLICLFRIPESDKAEPALSITIRAGEHVLLANRQLVPEASDSAHYFSVVTLMKDEGPYLREWIEYYRILGADHFYIYDNRSLTRSSIRALLKPYVEKGIVTLLDWDYPYTVNEKNSYRFCQRGQMHHCLYKYGDVNKWLLFIDVDEYIYPVDSDTTSLLPLLRENEEKPEVAALQFKMIWFGNSGHDERARGLVIENYKYRAPAVVHSGREKCCVKPDKVKLLFVHAVKQCIEGTEVQIVAPERYRINHYYMMSASRKRRRDNKHNEVEDSGMSKFIPELTEQLEQNQ